MISNINITLAAYGIDEKNVISTLKGVNSIIYKCQKTDGSYIGVKEYLGDATRCIRSMEREVDSINFLYQHNFKNIAKLISFNKLKPSICYEWIDGSIPEGNNFIKSQIVDALVSLKLIHNFNPNFPLAIDAVSSLTKLNEQIEQRMLVAKTYLNDYPSIWQLIKKSQVLKVKDSFLNDTFPINTFSFSDIGTHNMIINSVSKVYFLDFEFFGADSKVKMIADIFSHPRTIFTKEEIISLAFKLSLSDCEFKQLINIIPEIAIKWALITSRRLSGNILIDGNSVAQILEQIKDYLEYSQYLRGISEIDMILTFPEFKRMQQ